MRSKTKLLLIGILICSTNIYPESKTATSCTVIEHGKKYYDERGKIETFSELVLCAKLNDFDFDSTNFFNGLKKLKNVKVVSASFVDFSRLNECFIEKMFTI